MRTVDEITEALAAPGVRLEEVAAETGLSFNTVRLYAKGKAAANPRFSSIRLLSEWLDKREAEQSAPV